MTPEEKALIAHTSIPDGLMNKSCKPGSLMK
jgi:hypothetical protein